MEKLTKSPLKIVETLGFSAELGDGISDHIAAGLQDVCFRPWRHEIRRSRLKNTSSAGRSSLIPFRKPVDIKILVLIRIFPISLGGAESLV